MYYVDAQKTVTRRDSSLIREGIPLEGNDEFLFPARAPSTTVKRLTSVSSGSLVQRPWGSVEREIVTSLFENMLDCIVVSWNVIAPKTEDLVGADYGKIVSDLNIGRKKRPALKPSKTKRSRSRLDVQEPVQQLDLTNICWWSCPDEKATIVFKNGNIYEGNISWKSMHGEGRFQWADGTVYLGDFCDNQIKGKGIIQWKDDMWYQGDFVGNLRHGQGLYVDSRNQKSYAGGWHCGAKHGKGVIHYSENNSYDGDWIHNVRTGYGVREYDKLSGYMGEWERNSRQGQGMMIWPNNDFYKGEWNNAVMHGYGLYVWRTFFNNSMSLPSINVYRGFWEAGLRHGYGVLNLGMGHGALYMGMFKKNKKHGAGKVVTNNGFIFEHKSLFCGDILGPVTLDQTLKEDVCPPSEEPHQFDMCDDTVGLRYHIQYALNSFDKQEEWRTEVINNYIENNKDGDARLITVSDVVIKPTTENSKQFEDYLKFEESILKNAVKNYLSYIQKIYYNYATICNTEDIIFNPILIRLYLWQFFFDIDIHHKGLKLIDIDRMFTENKDWLINAPHCPFEKIYFWQFLNILIAVSNKLYSKKCLPGPRPETILGEAFKMFMENDVLPLAGRKIGHLVNGQGGYMPLKAMYLLYCKLGEPHTIRTFMSQIRKSKLYTLEQEEQQSEIIETPDKCIPYGLNKYIIGDEMMFILDDHMDLSSLKEDYDHLNHDYKLFNICNLSTKFIIQLFSDIFPEVTQEGVVVNLDVEFTFFEFYQVLTSCIEESIRIKEEEIRWREKFLESPLNSSPNSGRTAAGKVESNVAAVRPHLSQAANVKAAPTQK